MLECHILNYELNSSALSLVEGEVKFVKFDSCISHSELPRLLSRRLVMYQHFAGHKVKQL
jgi:hypothetical protein